MQQVIAVLIGHAKADKRERAEHSVDVEEEAGGLDGSVHTGHFSDLCLDAGGNPDDLFPGQSRSKARQNGREDFGIVVDRQDRQVDGVDDGDDRSDQEDREDDDKCQWQGPSEVAPEVSDRVQRACDDGVSLLM
jgi:hypothetical protein